MAQPPAKAQTGIVYDARFLAHRSAFDHPEHPIRVKTIMSFLKEQGLSDRCVSVPARLAELEELALVHTQEHIDKILNLPNRFRHGDVYKPGDSETDSDEEREALESTKGDDAGDLTRVLSDKLQVLSLDESKQKSLSQGSEKAPEVKKEKKPFVHVDITAAEAEAEDVKVRHNSLSVDSDTYFCSHSTQAARLACGGLTELCSQVVQGKLQNGFAVIRPPGHHCNQKEASGFCLLNNVAVAVRAVKKLHPDIKRIAIVDWDVHHGNGTQDIFDDDPAVLFYSIHRYQGGTFYPNSGGPLEVGKGAGLGRTVNMPLPTTGLGDAEYLQTFHQLLLPILKEFKPQLVIVSAGFDCAAGDPLGGMEVSSDGFFHMTRMLMDPHVVEGGRVVLALEGGYNPNQISQAVCSCVSALLGDALPVLEEQARPWSAAKACTECKVPPPSPQDIASQGKTNSFAEMWGSNSSRNASKLQAKRALFSKTLQEVIKVQARFWKSLK